MSDVILFLLGCFVSLIVASAVGLLLWAAANESKQGPLTPERREALKREADVARTPPLREAESGSAV